MGFVMKNLGLMNRINREMDAAAGIHTYRNLGLVVPGDLVRLFFLDGTVKQVYIGRERLFNVPPNVLFAMVNNKITLDLRENDEDLDREYIRGVDFYASNL